MNTFIAPALRNLIDVVKFMRQLKKHKGPLFIYKKVDGTASYEFKSLVKDDSILSLVVDVSIYVTNYLIEYHPYIHIFHRRPKLVLSIDFSSPSTDMLANLTADCEWLKAQMKYPPLAKRVRGFENNIENQHKDSRAYLARFYQADRPFLFHRIFIVFPTQIENADHLESMLTSITAFRIKLISQLKNHDLISEQQTRYLWKVIVKGNQLCLHVLIVRKRPTSIGFSFDSYKNRNEQRLLEQINNTAEKLSLTVSGPEITIDFTQDTAKDKRKNFNAYLNNYFNQDFWFAYYRIPCKEVKKMLFGKGNDKDGQ